MSPSIRLFGYEVEDLLGTSGLALIHPDDTGAAPDQLGRKLTVGARPFSVEFRMKHRRGHWVWVQSVGLQMTSAAGELERVVGFHLDVTDRKQLEEESLANDARLQDLSGAGPLAARTRGAGRRLVFVHGFTQTGHSWERVAEHFAAGSGTHRHQVALVDLPGHGGSSAIRADLRRTADLLASTTGEATYIGYSLGGRVCLHLALMYPHVVERLVLLGATPMAHRRLDVSLALRAATARVGRRKRTTPTPLPRPRRARRWLGSRYPPRPGQRCG